MRDHAACTALHHATLYAHAPVVALLLAHGAAADAAAVHAAARLASDSAVARAYQAAGVAVPGTPCASDGSSDDAPGPAQYHADVGGVMTAFDVVDVTALPDGAGGCDSEPGLLFATSGDDGAADALPHIRDECPAEPPRKLYVTGAPDDGSDGSDGGGFSLRVQQSLMFGVALVVGALMVAVVAARPHGFRRGSMPEHTVRSSGEDQWLSKLSEKNTLVLRILSTICFGAVALLAVWLARQRTKTLQGHAGLLGFSGLVMCVYEIVAIIAIG